MNVPELRAELERRAAEAERIGATAPVAAIYRALIEEIATLNGTGSAPRPDRLLTAHEVAPRLGCSPRYIYAHAKDFPFTRKLGNLVRFSEHGLADYLRHGRAA